MSKITFLIQCPDQPGLVAKISTYFYHQGLNMLDCQEHVDSRESRYYMRVELSGEGMSCTREQLEQGFAALAAPLSLEWEVNYSEDLTKVAIMVSKRPHCLYDLLVRHEQNELPCDIRLIIGNHPDLAPVAEKFDIPFYSLPVAKDPDPAVYAQNRAEHEAAVKALLDEHQIDLTILARYMLILSPDFIADYPKQMINVHHAMLPAFKGANPYGRAYDRGVKIIGATAHYVTLDLDEGPIIEQDVERVSHENSPKALTRIGADIERLVLARAVKAHLESRIIVCKNRTVVFS